MYIYSYTKPVEPYSAVLEVIFFGFKYGFAVKKGGFLVDKNPTSQE